MNEKSLERLRNMYPAGTRVRLLHMDDIQAPPYNTLGTIKNIDDMGTIHVSWDTGSCLGLVLGVDRFETVVN